MLKSLNSPLAWAPNLEDAIERHPITVPPTLPLVEAIALISQARRHTCSLTEDLTATEATEVRASCVLVMRGEKLVGILTERDVVRLTARAVNFAEATVEAVMVHPVITLPQESIQDIFAALFLFRRYRIRHLPIVDRQGHLVGVISNESIRQILRPANLLRFRRVSDVMTTQVVHAPLTTPVLALAQMMADYQVSCIVITQRDWDDHLHPVGVVTERDIVQFQAFQIDLGKTQAETVMSTPLFLLSPEDSLWTAHQEMQRRRVGRLVVSWNWGQGLGIVTQTSLLRIFDPMEMYGVIENLQQTIQKLEIERLAMSPPMEPPLSVLSSPTLSQPAFLESMPAAPAIPGEGDRPPLLDLIQHAYASVQRIVDHPDCAEGQRRSLTQFLLEPLDQLKHGIKG